MPVVEVNDVDRYGQINDIAPYKLPPEAWTVIENMRFEKKGIAVMSGWQQVFGTPGVAPHFALPVKTSSQTYWLYVSLTKGYVFDGTTHTNITRQTASVDVNYTANQTSDWNGVVFGGVPILNNGIDVPQYWASYSTAVKLAALPNWTSTLRAKIIRNMGSYLMAFNITDSGTRYPHLVQWSNPASPGTVPTSWAYGNPATEGGRKDLPDVNSGEILEAMQLGNSMMIYKERSSWKATYIGGQFIWQWDTVFADVGILAPRCVCFDPTGTRHVMATQDDIIIHNGNKPTSLLTDIQRKTLFDTINRDALTAAFIFLNKPKDEVWFCYPEAGQTIPTRALVLKWFADDRWRVTYASGITFRNAVLGDVEGASSELWSQGTDTWADDTGPWSQVFRQKIILCGTDATKFYQLDQGILRDSSTFAPSLVRTGLGIIGVKAELGIINDFKQVKMLDSVWPKIEGETSIRVRSGYQETVNGPVTWQDYATFDPTTQMWVNVIQNEELPGAGVAFALEFSALTAATWRLDGYAVNVTPLGPYLGAPYE